MKTQVKILAIAVCLFSFHLSANAQSRLDKNFSVSLGAGYFQAFVNAEGVTYSNAVYDPNVGPGVSYFVSFDYHLSETFAIGVGYNGNFASGEFVRNATVSNETINGFLEAGAVTNTQILLNATYTPQGRSAIQPFGKLGIGYLTQQVENGDVPMRLTGGVEMEIFPDFKNSGIGLLPEVGIRYNDFSLSAAYSIGFNKLTGEDNPDGFVSPGTVSSSALQINVSYRIFLF